MAGLLAASVCLALSSSAHASDVFGGAAPSNGQSAALLERLNTLERELKELKANGAQSTPAGSGVPVGGTATAKVKAPIKVAPPPGLEDLPGGGADERERLIVEKELTHEVLGTINGMLLVRDGEKRLVMSDTEFKAFEKKKRQKVVRRMKMEAVTEGDGARLSFPQLTPPPPPELEGSELSRAGSVVGQARAIEANGGQLPSPPPAASTIGQNKPASPVKKN